MSSYDNVQDCLNMFSEDNEKENIKYECSSLFNNISTKIKIDDEDNLLNQNEKYFNQVQDGNTNAFNSDANYKTTTERMLKRDSIYKKIKSKFFGFLHKKVKNLIKKEKKLSKLKSNTTINNVTLEFNKILFNNSLEQIYMNDLGLFKTKKDLKDFTENNKESDKLKKILSLKLSDLFISYLNDDTYGVDKLKISQFSLIKKKINNDDVRKYIEIIDYHAFQLLDYYKISI